MPSLQKLAVAFQGLFLLYNGGIMLYNPSAVSAASSPLAGTPHPVLHALA
jgi:hypothetical protein